MIKQRHHLVLVLAILTGVASFFLLSGTSSAATINVTTTDTPSAVDGNCTLREAIENINDQPTQTNLDCTAGDGVNDTITIPAGTITLQADLPLITKSVSIQGAGMGATTISGAGAWKVIDFQPTTDQTFVVTKMKITGFAQGAILGRGGNYRLNQLDIDGTNVAPTNTDFGIAIVGLLNTVESAELENIYVHDFSMNMGNFQPVIVSNSSATDNTALLENITLTRIRNTGQMNVVTATTNTLGSGGVGNLSVVANNITIEDATSATATVSGLGAIAFGIANKVDLHANNVTIGRLQGVDSFIPGIAAPGLFAASAGYDTQQQPHANLLVTNAVSTDNDGCGTADISSFVGAPGTAVSTITSQGGNLSDDNSCSPYFTQPTDQNNLTGLAATLSALADNGGYVPTMALKQGSPAIDSGITVAGLTTDARGAARPQGSAYDSGAYESPYTKPAVVTAAAKPTLASSGQSLLIALGGVSVLTTLGLFATKRRLAYKRV